jgi:hypothetical protein
MWIQIHVNQCSGRHGNETPECKHRDGCVAMGVTCQLTLRVSFILQSRAPDKVSFEEVLDLFLATLIFSAESHVTNNGPPRHVLGPLALALCIINMEPRKTQRTHLACVATSRMKSHV